MPAPRSTIRIICNQCRKTEWHIYTDDKGWICLQCWADAVVSIPPKRPPEAPATTSLDTAFTSAR